MEGNAIFFDLLSDNHEKGKIFEKICKLFLETDPIYAAKLKNVWFWNEWPDRWGPDNGIDLIAETYEGNLWAIQAKAYSNNHIISRHDVNSFLSESSDSRFSYRLLIATTDLLSSALKRIIKRQGNIGTILLQNLKNSNIAWPDTVKDLCFKAKEKQIPKPHQMEAIENILCGFQKERRGLVVMPCGTGKTNVGLWVAEKIEAKKILVLLPSLSLLKQTLESWSANASRLFHFLPVCSDETVANEDSIVSSIYELGIESTTNSVIISKFLLQENATLVVFGTYHSSLEVAKACSLANVEFDLVIADEAHRCAGSFLKKFSTVVREGEIKTKKRLFMTATPKIFSKNLKQIAQNFGHSLISMDDISMFGNIFHKLSFADAIKRDLLSDYRVVIVGVEENIYDDFIKKRTLVTFDGKKITDAKSLAAMVAISLAMRKCNLSRLLSFHNTIKGARKFSEEFPSVLNWISPEYKPEGKVFCDYVEGKMSTDVRNRKISRLKTLLDCNYMILSNSRCLAEGVDLPTLDGIIFIDPRRSQIDIIQAIGRAIRKSDNKTMGIIIVPMIIKKGADNEEAFNNSEYKYIWDILKALRSHDESLGMKIDSLRQELGRTGFINHNISDKITFDMPLWVDESFIRSLEIQIIEECSRGWNFYFGLLERYVSIKGHANVPSVFILDGYKLGSWVSVQRKGYKSKSLALDKINQLENLPGWIWDALDAQWNEGFRLLNDFFQTHGHIHVPYNYCVGNFNVSAWVSVQRRRFKQGKMFVDRQQKLESIPGWIWDIFDSKWEKGIGMLSAFYDREKHVNVPHDHVEQGFRLGIWVSNRKIGCSKGILSVEKQKILEQFIGWAWENNTDANWSCNYELLKEFVKEYAHAKVPRGCKYKGSNLDVWVATQRRAYKLGNLSTERISKLESFFGWSWNTIKDRDEAALRALNSFVQREGRALVPTNYIEKGFALGKWVSRQRLYYYQGILEKDIIDRLESYPDWFWDANKGYWERGKRFLLQFVAREGHSLVKNKHIEKGFALGKWVQMYRYLYKKGKLSKDKIDFFESLPKWIWRMK